MNSQPNQIFFKWEHGSEITTFEISGVKILVSQIRKHIEQQFNSKNDDIKIFYEDKILNISDEVRSKQILNLVRVPKNRLICLSCFNLEFTTLTQCCKKQICANCESVFCQKSKCFFNINYKCQYIYSENYQNMVPEPLLDEFFTFNSNFYLMRTNKLALANSKRFSVFSCRELTYLKLSQDFSYSTYVILIFIINDEIVGLAKMINQLVICEQQNQQFKSFKIQWLRRQPSTKKLYDFQIYEVREYVKLPKGLGKQICLSFPVGQMPSENTQPKQIDKEIQQKEQSSPIWDLDEIFDEKEETVKKNDECIKPTEQVSAFEIPEQQENKQKEESKEKELENQKKQEIVEAVSGLAQIQELFNKMNNGQIPGIKGDNKYIHPMLSMLCFSLISNSNENSNENQQKKRKQNNRSSSPSSNSRSCSSSNSSLSSSPSERKRKSKRHHSKRRRRTPSKESHDYKSKYKSQSGNNNKNIDKREQQRREKNKEQKYRDKKEKAKNKYKEKELNRNKY